ncbi:hypothetical protein [Flavobacterium sp.]|uniref:hypothetical protein n=1 Tax=Flavobacterium sp. TaxID=239 RepID=UPI0031E2D8DC
MKNLSFIALFLISTACSTDSIEQNTSTAQNTAKKTNLSGVAASNSFNPYDNVGESYLLLLDNYDVFHPKPSNSIDAKEVLETIGTGMGILNASYIPESLQSIAAVQQLSIDDLSLAISQSGLSTQAQGMLLNCISGLLLLKEQDAAYDEAYAFLIAFESQVISSNLSAEEKQILLSTLSIVRYDIYNGSARKGKDRDWELSVGNFVSTAYGAKQSSSHAIINAGISNILH